MSTKLKGAGPTYKMRNQKANGPKGNKIAKSRFSTTSKSASEIKENRIPSKDKVKSKVVKAKKGY